MPKKTLKTDSDYTSQVVITFTPKQKIQLEKYTKSRGLSMASFIRYNILKEINFENIQDNKTPLNSLSEFAGILDEQTADKMLDDIYTTRKNKE